MRGASPNVISLVGMIAGLGVGAAVAATASVPGPILNRLCFAAAAVLIQLRLLANMLDGMGADACYYRRTMDRRSATMADCPAPPGTVLITFACIGDLHTCPMSDGPKPHVGGPVAMGCGNVFIAGMPAARVSDTTTCAGPPDGLAMGSQTVMIAGIPAARIGDSTMHGGVVTADWTDIHTGTDGDSTMHDGVVTAGCPQVIID